VIFVDKKIGKDNSRLVSYFTYYFFSVSARSHTNQSGLVKDMNTKKTSHFLGHQPTMYNADSDNPSERLRPQTCV